MMLRSISTIRRLGSGLLIAVRSVQEQELASPSKCGAIEMKQINILRVDLFVLPTLRDDGFSARAS